MCRCAYRHRPFLLLGPVALLLVLEPTSRLQADTLTDPSLNVVEQGSTPFTAYGYDTHGNITSELNAKVDYAVFAPGTFPSTLGGKSFVPSSTDYVYAYQVFNEGYQPPPVINPPPTSLALDVASVDFNYNNSKQEGVVSSDIDAVGQSNPSNSTSAIPFFDPTGLGPITNDSVKFYFEFDGEITPGEQSYLLFFSSPILPSAGLGYVEGGGVSSGTQDNSADPTSIPSPANLSLTMNVFPATPSPSPWLAAGVFMLGTFLYRRLHMSRHG